MVQALRQLRLALSVLLQSSPGALHLFAPVCSTLCRVSRGTSWRTVINCFGDQTSDWVAQGNLMISRQFNPTYTRLRCTVLDKFGNHPVFVLAAFWFPSQSIAYLWWSSLWEVVMCSPSTQDLDGSVTVWLSTLRCTASDCFPHIHG